MGAAVDFRREVSFKLSSFTSSHSVRLVSRHSEQLFAITVAVANLS